MKKYSFRLDPQDTIAEVDPHLFGSFIEHLGRAVYTGIYEPGHPRADADGLRTDVIELVRELHVTTVRYPGGNYVSGFNWRDAIGPKELRPVRLDYAWLSRESNQFGIDEFAVWCRKVGVEPMLAVNLGTGTPQEAGYFIEYCNHEGGTALSDLRVRHGRKEPYDFKLWCLGNEMDGFWQTGHMDAREYAAKARETAKILRWVDPDVTLIACGSSNSALPSFPEWDRIILEELYEHVDFISCHQYYENEGNDRDFLASFVNMDQFIETVISTANYVKALHRSSREMKISFDEWNVWYQHAAPWEDAMKDRANRFRSAPALLEDHYSFLDALVVGGLLCSLINHCDRVKMACLAQLVNVIAPIFTRAGGGVIRQTIFWPFALVASVCRGTALRYSFPVATFDSRHGAARMIQSSIVYNEERKRLYLFALNCDFDAECQLTVDLEAFGTTRVVEHLVLRSTDLHARNTFDQPDRVRPEAISCPAASAKRQVLSLPACSWSRITIETNCD